MIRFSNLLVALAFKLGFLYNAAAVPFDTSENPFDPTRPDHQGLSFQLFELCHGLRKHFVTPLLKHPDTWLPHKWRETLRRKAKIATTARIQKVRDGRGKRGKGATHGSDGDSEADFYSDTTSKPVSSDDITFSRVYNATVRKHARNILGDLLSESDISALQLWRLSHGARDRGKRKNHQNTTLSSRAAKIVIGDTVESWKSIWNDIDSEILEANTDNDVLTSSDLPDHDSGGPGNLNLPRLTALINAFLRQPIAELVAAGNPVSAPDVPALFHVCPDSFYGLLTSLLRLTALWGDAISFRFYSSGMHATFQNTRFTGTAVKKMYDLSHAMMDTVIREASYNEGQGGMHDSLKEATEWAASQGGSIPASARDIEGGGSTMADLLRRFQENLMRGSEVYTVPEWHSTKSKRENDLERFPSDISLDGSDGTKSPESLFPPSALAWSSIKNQRGAYPAEQFRPTTGTAPFIQMTNARTLDKPFYNPFTGVQHRQTSVEGSFMPGSRTTELKGKVLHVLGKYFRAEMLRGDASQWGLEQRVRKVRKVSGEETQLEKETNTMLPTPDSKLESRRLLMEHNPKIPSSVVPVVIIRRCDRWLQGLNRIRPVWGPYLREKERKVVVLMMLDGVQCGAKVEITGTLQEEEGEMVVASLKTATKDSKTEVKTNLAVVASRFKKEATSMGFQPAVFRWDKGGEGGTESCIEAVRSTVNSVFLTKREGDVHEKLIGGKREEDVRDRLARACSTGNSKAGLLERRLRNFVYKEAIKGTDAGSTTAGKHHILMMNDLTFPTREDVDVKLQKALELLHEHKTSAGTNPVAVSVTDKLHSRRLYNELDLFSKSVVPSEEETKPVAKLLDRYVEARNEFLYSSQGYFDVSSEKDATAVVFGVGKVAKTVNNGTVSVLLKGERRQQEYLQTFQERLTDRDEHRISSGNAGSDSNPGKKKGVRLSGGFTGLVWDVQDGFDSYLVPVDTLSPQENPLNSASDDYEIHLAEGMLAVQPPIVEERCYQFTRMGRDVAVAPPPVRTDVQSMCKLAKATSGRTTAINSVSSMTNEAAAPVTVSETLPADLLLSCLTDAICPHHSHTGLSKLKGEEFENSDANGDGDRWSHFNHAGPNSGDDDECFHGCHTALMDNDSVQTLAESRLRSLERERVEFNMLSANGFATARACKLARRKDNRNSVEYLSPTCHSCMRIHAQKKNFHPQGRRVLSEGLERLYRRKCREYEAVFGEPPEAPGVVKTVQVLRGEVGVLKGNDDKGFDTNRRESGSNVNEGEDTDVNEAGEVIARRSKVPFRDPPLKQDALWGQPDLSVDIFNVFLERMAQLGIFFPAVSVDRLPYGTDHAGSFEDPSGAETNMRLPILSVIADDTSEFSGTRSTKTIMPEIDTGLRLTRVQIDKSAYNLECPHWEGRSSVGEQESKANNDEDRCILPKSSNTTVKERSLTFLTEFVRKWLPNLNTLLPLEDSDRVSLRVNAVRSFLSQSAVFRKILAEKLVAEFSSQENISADSGSSTGSSATSTSEEEYNAEDITSTSKSKTISEIPPPKLVFTWVDSSDHTHELFHGCLMDFIDFLNLLSQQGSGNSQSPQDTSQFYLDYSSTAFPMIKQKSFQGQEEKKRLERKVFPDDYFEKDETHSDALPEIIESKVLPRDDFYYWSPAGIAGLKARTAIYVQNLFDMSSLDKFLKSRGVGGVVARKKHKGQAKQESEGKSEVSWLRRMLLGSGSGARPKDEFEETYSTLTSPNDADSNHGLNTDTAPMLPQQPFISQMRLENATEEIPVAFDNKGEAVQDYDLLVHVTNLPGHDPIVPYELGFKSHYPCEDRDEDLLIDLDAEENRGEDKGSQSSDSVTGRVKRLLAHQKKILEAEKVDGTGEELFTKEAIPTDAYYAESHFPARAAAVENREEVYQEFERGRIRYYEEHLPHGGEPLPGHREPGYEAFKGSRYFRHRVTGGRKFYPLNRYYDPPAIELRAEHSGEKYKPPVVGDVLRPVPLLGSSEEIEKDLGAVREAIGAEKGGKDASPDPGNLQRRIPLMRFEGGLMSFKRTRCIRYQEDGSTIHYGRFVKAVQDEIRRYYKDYHSKLKENKPGEAKRDFIRIAVHGYILEDQEEIQQNYGVYGTINNPVVSPSIFAGLRLNRELESWALQILRNIERERFRGTVGREVAAVVEANSILESTRTSKDASFDLTLSPQLQTLDGVMTQQSSVGAKALCFLRDLQKLTSKAKELSATSISEIFPTIACGGNLYTTPEFDTLRKSSPQISNVENLDAIPISSIKELLHSAVFGETWTVHWRRGDTDLDFRRAKRSQAAVVSSPSGFVNVVRRNICAVLGRKRTLWDQVKVAMQVKSRRKQKNTNDPSQDSLVLNALKSVLIPILDEVWAPRLGQPDIMESCDMGHIDMNQQTSVFIMTNEKSKSVIEGVKEKCEKTGKFKCYFLKDFVTGGELKGVFVGAGAIGKGNGRGNRGTGGTSEAAEEKDTDPNDSENDPRFSLALPGFKDFITQDPTGNRLFFTEIAVASIADRFIGYGTSRLNGDCSVPSMVINQLRLLSYGTAPALWLLQPPEQLFRMM